MRSSSRHPCLGLDAQTGARVGACQDLFNEPQVHDTRSYQQMAVADRTGNKGTVVQVIGPVVDVAFEGEHLPDILHALGGDLDELAEALAADDTRPLVHLAARPGQISAAELAELTGGQVALYSPCGVYLAEGGDPGELGAPAVARARALLHPRGRALGQ